jgi:hypothetical protein
MGSQTIFPSETLPLFSDPGESLILVNWKGDDMSEPGVISGSF